EEVVADRVERGRQHRLFALEVVVQGRPGHPGRRADVVHGDAVVPAGREQLDRDGEDLLLAGAPPAWGGRRDDTYPAAHRALRSLVLNARLNPHSVSLRPAPPVRLNGR